MSISQIRTHKYGSGHFDPLKIARNIRPEKFENILLLISKELNNLFPFFNKSFTYSERLQLNHDLFLT